MVLQTIFSAAGHFSAAEPPLRTNSRDRRRPVCHQSVSLQRRGRRPRAAFLPGHSVLLFYISSTLSYHCPTSSSLKSSPYPFPSSPVLPYPLLFYPCLSMTSEVQTHLPHYPVLSASRSIVPCSTPFHSVLSCPLLSHFNLPYPILSSPSYIVLPYHISPYTVLPCSSSSSPISALLSDCSLDSSGSLLAAELSCGSHSPCLPPSQR